MTLADLQTRYCPWMLEATRLLGQAEIPGPQTAGFIAAMLKGLHAWWTDDETPWCGTFVGHCLQTAGLPIAKQWWRARGWENFGLSYPRTLSPNLIPYGALVVLNRPPRPGDGHVGFFAGTTFHTGAEGPHVSLLAGNQGNKVCFASFPLGRVVSWSWPGPPLPGAGHAALVVQGNGRQGVALSTGEA